MSKQGKKKRKWTILIVRFQSYRSPCRRDNEFVLKRDPCIFDPVARMQQAQNKTNANLYKCIYCPLGWRRDGSRGKIVLLIWFCLKFYSCSVFSPQLLQESLKVSLSDSFQKEK